MDLTYVWDDNIVHLRSRGVIRNGNRLLVLRDIYRYWYQVGGRISHGESSLDAMKRELEEELHLENCRIVRPLFLSEHTVFRRNRHNQEFVVYWEIDTSGTDLQSRGMHFETIDDDRNIRHEWAWLTEEEIMDYGFYPNPLLPLMFNPPERFSLVSTHEERYTLEHDMCFNMEGRLLGISVEAVFEHEGRVLTLVDERTHSFHLPGGFLHFGESFEDAMKRCVWEKLHVKSDILKPLKVSETFQSINGNSSHGIHVYHLMETNGDVLDSVVGNSFRWIPTEELTETGTMPPLYGTEALDTDREFHLTVERY